MLIITLHGNFHTVHLWHRIAPPVRTSVRACIVLAIMRRCHFNGCLTIGIKRNGARAYLPTIPRPKTILIVERIIPLPVVIRRVIIVRSIYDIFQRFSLNRLTGEIPSRNRGSQYVSRNELVFFHFDIQTEFRFAVVLNFNPGRPVNSPTVQISPPLGILWSRNRLNRKRVVSCFNRFRQPKRTIQSSFTRKSDNLIEYDIFFIPISIFVQSDSHRSVGNTIHRVMIIAQY